MAFLFPDFERTYNKRADHDHSSYQFLNESTWKAATYVRSQMQEWALDFPLDRDFVKRFTSNDDKEHLAAFFEMVIFQWLRRQNYHVGFHDPIPNGSTRRIDFSAVRNNEPPFLAECTLSAMPDDDPGISKLKAQIKDTIESIRCDRYWIFLEFEKCSSMSLPKRDLTQFIEMMIRDGQGNSEPQLRRRKWTLSKRGWNLIFSLAPKSNSDRTLGMTIDGPAHIINSERPLRTALDRKRGMLYGNLERPYVICLNANDIYLDNLSIMRTLFGRWSHETGFHTGPFGRQSNDGFLITNDKPQNTSVSAVLIAKYLVPWNLHVCRTSLWHNPWAKYPLSEIALDMNQYSFKQFEEREFKMESSRGRQIGDVLGVDPDYMSDDVD